MACILICLSKVLLASHLFCLISLSQGFSTKIIYRDSPISPLYHSNLSYIDAFWRDIKTSKIRASNFIEMRNSDSVKFSLFFRAPLFTLDISIGTPATKTSLVFDTAAPLTWTQCQPCIKCFKQDYPIFDPSMSTSYKRVRRNHILAPWFNCTILECYYYVASRGGQSSQGIISMETFSFLGSSRINKQVLTDVVFGCGTYNHGRLGPQTTLTGILGMGNSPTSLVRQLGNRFSYCLPALKSSRTKTAVLSFGQEAAINGKNIQKTPFLRLPKMRGFVQGTFRLNLIGISVAGKRMEVPEGSFDGGCILDTGAPFSIIEEQAFKVVLNAFSSYFAQFKNIKKIVNKRYPKNLCYKYPWGFKKFPSMILHFEGANLEVNGTSLFMFQTSLLLSNFMCLQLLGEPKTNILGVYQQQNIRLLYDSGNDQLSFVRENC